MKLVQIPLRGRDGEPRAFALVDPVDEERVTAVGRWSLSRQGYAIHNAYDPARPNTPKQIRLHRLILGMKDDTRIVHHVNGNKLDCRRQNLRVFASHVEHMAAHWEAA